LWPGDFEISLHSSVQNMAQRGKVNLSQLLFDGQVFGDFRHEAPLLIGN
jgi:hypothetical protein